MSGILIDPYYLHSIRNQSAFTWKKIVCELIDNAFDADATEVNISWPGGSVFRISDNGKGTDDLTRMIKLGHRHEQSTNDVGRYGVGCKHALIWLWGRSVVTSKIAVGDCKYIESDWASIAAGEAAYPGEIMYGGEINEHGTLIECYADRGYPDNVKLCADISATYSPGLEIGKRIVVKRGKQVPRPLQPTVWPDCVRCEQDSIEAAGRSVTVKMGIVREGVSNPYEKGFSFERTYRVIKQSLLGANGFAASRLAGRIVLGKEWELSTNKDDFFEFNEELGDAIYERFEHLMREASEQAISFEESSFNAELSQIVNDAFSTRRESRKQSQGAVGTIEPKGTGRKRERATESTDADGSVVDDAVKQRKRRRGGYSVDTYNEPDGSQTFGYYDESANTVRLNMENNWLKERWKVKCMDALLPVMMGIIANHEQSRDDSREPLFKGGSKDFSNRWGSTVVNASEKGIEL